MGVFEVQDLGFRVQVSGFGVWGLGFRAFWSLGLKVSCERKVVAQPQGYVVTWLGSPSSKPRTLNPNP